MALGMNRTSVYTVKFVQNGQYVLEDFVAPGQSAAEDLFKQKYQVELASGAVQLVNTFRKQ